MSLKLDVPPQISGVLLSMPNGCFTSVMATRGWPSCPVSSVSQGSSQSGTIIPFSFEMSGYEIRSASQKSLHPMLMTRVFTTLSTKSLEHSKPSVHIVG